MILYLTQEDADMVREWINAESCVAWIIPALNSTKVHSWKAVDQLDSIRQQGYAIWHKHAGALNIPSGQLSVPDDVVQDPYAGWVQKLDSAGHTEPWFGGNLPGPYSFRFRESGVESPGSLGRSDFGWAGDHYRLIGMPAHPEARRWWNRLRRFVRSRAVGIPWPDVSGSGRTGAYAFPSAHAQIRSGRAVDLNP